MCVVVPLRMTGADGLQTAALRTAKANKERPAFRFNVRSSAFCCWRRSRLQLPFASCNFNRASKKRTASANQRTLSKSERPFRPPPSQTTSSPHSGTTRTRRESENRDVLLSQAHLSKTLISLSPIRLSHKLATLIQVQSIWSASSS